MATDGGAGGGVEVEGGLGMRVRPFPDFDAMATPSQTQLQMLTSASSPSAIDLDVGSYGGAGAGGGGKSKTIRRNARSSTPYSRPSIGRHASAGPHAAALISNGGVTPAQALAERRGLGGAWLGSGISKILSTGATYLYSSIFRRRLPAPVRLLDVQSQSVDADEQISTQSSDSEERQAGNGQAVHISSGPLMANSDPSDVERLFNQKTLSRDEFERLTLLLQSRVVNKSVEKKKQVKHVGFDLKSTRQEIQSSGGNQSEAQRWRQDLQKSREERENGPGTLTIYENGGSVSRAAGDSESLDALGGSPVDLAIAFMGGRPSRPSESSPFVEPSNQRDENLLTSSPLQMPLSTLAKWSPPEFLNEDQFFTPPPASAHSWGRDRTISRTPYSRPVRLSTSRERAIDGTFGPPAATRWTPIRTPVTGGREMLKRRSTVLDDSWSSGGPIRRLRHKAIVPVTPSSVIQSRGSPYLMTPTPSSSQLTLPSPVGGKIGAATPSQRYIGPSRMKEEDAISASSNFYVPAQSSETARKILETLEKMTPSPKGKSLGEELAHVREKPPSTLTETMLNEQARKSMTTLEYSIPSASREPGPSGRSLENESASFGNSGIPLKTPDYKLKGKGKAPLPPIGNGIGGQGDGGFGLERTTPMDAPVEKLPARSKEIETVTVPSEADKVKGFRMSAVFEESGSEDEGRLGKTNIFASALPTSASKVPSVPPAPKSAIGMSSMFGNTVLGPTTTAAVGLAATLANTPAVDTSKAVTSGFTFPTRAPLEGPPTPKAMSTAGTPPKTVPADPFLKFPQAVEPPVTLDPTPEQKTIATNVDSHIEMKSEYSFGSPSPAVSTATQSLPRMQPASDSTIPNVSKPNTSIFGVPPSSATTISTLPPAGAATSSLVSPGSSSSLKFGDTFSTAPSSTLKVGTIPPSTPLFTSSSSLFGQGSTSAPTSSATSMNFFASNSGHGTSASTNLFASGLGAGTSASLSMGTSGFGQSNLFAFKSPAPGPSLVPVLQASIAKDSKDSSSPLPELERPHKRPVPSLEQDLSKRQQPLATVSSHSFTTFGTSIGNSPATVAMPVTFAAPGSSAATSQGLFSVSSFGQASSSAPQISSASSSAAPIQFSFAAPASTVGNTSSASASFTNTPSFPSFTSSVFGAASSGSTFGVTAAPMPFGSTSAAVTFGSTGAKPVFGGFGSESAPQSQPTPLFGSGFASQSPSTAPAFAFGGSAAAPAFGFSAGSSSTSSGPAFAFGSTVSFPFPANKSGPPVAQASIFGLTSSIPAFGSTTNGTMASDVVVNDQSNMDDNSMAEEPPQVTGGILPPSTPSLFGGLSSAGSGSFVFGSQTGALGAGGSGPSPLFGGFPPQPSPPGFGAATPNPFAAQPAGSLDFAGGSFTLGSGGDRPTRKIFRAKRTGAKRGK